MGVVGWYGTDGPWRLMKGIEGDVYVETPWRLLVCCEIRVRYALGGKAKNFTPRESP